jgi:hypothetical protein
MLSLDPYKNYKVNALAKGRVVSATDFSDFMELESDIEALIKNKDISSFYDVIKVLIRDLIYLYLFSFFCFKLFNFCDF